MVTSDLRPGDIVNGTKRKDVRFLLILNQPIQSTSLLERLWTESDYKLCADGGANRLFDCISKTGDASKFCPDAIHGDLDSIRPDVQQYYEDQGVPITKSPDQESTDFGKAFLKLALLLYQKPEDTAFDNKSSIIVLGGISGRVDQGISVLHQLLCEQERHPDITIWLVSERSISVVLLKNEIYRISGLKTTPASFTRELGILPIYGPAYVVTSGLEWNLDWETRMGGRVSTSNHIIEDGVAVDVRGAPVLLTIERSDDYL